MRPGKFFSAGLVLLGLGAGCLSHVRAAELCRTATPKTLIAWYNRTHPHKPLRYDPKNSAIYHPIAMVRTAAPHLAWIGLAWLSPMWGAVFATDCSGKPLAAVSDGAVGKLAAGPTLPETGQTVRAEYADKETPACMHDSVAFLAFKHQRIVRLWRHALKQGMNVTHGKGGFNGFVTRNYRVQFEDSGRTLKLTGTLAAYPDLKNGSQSATPSATALATCAVLPMVTWISSCGWRQRNATSRCGSQ